MEQQYINQYKISFELFKEWANNPIGKNAIRNRKKGIRLRVIGIACSILIAALGVVTNDYLFILIGALTFVLFLVRLFYLPSKMIKKQYNLFKKSQNDKDVTRTITFADNIVIDDGRSSTHYDYSEISKMSEDEEYFYLFLNADMGLRVRKDSFIKGTCEDFRVYIYSELSNKAV